MENKGSDVQNKKLIILLSILVGMIAVLVVAIVVVHNVARTTKKLTEEQWDEKFEMESVALDDCEDIERSFRSGMLTEGEVNSLYEEMFNSRGSNFYKVRLTLCYADNMYNHNYNLEEAVSRLARIELLIEDANDYIDYYDRLIVYYVNADDWDKVRYYAELRDVLLPDGIESTEDDDLATDESDLVDTGQMIVEEERIDSNQNADERGSDE